MQNRRLYFARCPHPPFETHCTSQNSSPAPEINHPTNKSRALRPALSPSRTPEIHSVSGALSTWYQRKSTAPTLHAKIVVNRISHDHSFRINPKRLSVIDVTRRIELIYLAVGIAYKVMTVSCCIDVNAHDLTEYVEVDGKRSRIRTRGRTAIRRVETGHLAVQLACK